MAKRTPRRRRLESQIVQAATPVFLLDTKRRIVLFNVGCEQLTGWPAIDVLGKSCPYTSEADPEELATLCAALAPPPEVFDGKTAGVPAFLTRKDGESLPRTIHFHPILNADGTVESVMGVISEMPPMIARGTIVPAAQRLHAELSALRNSLRRRYGLKSLIARGPAMTRVLSQVAVARSSLASALISGEPGSGTSHIARVIHHEGINAAKSFVPLDCALLPARELRNTLRRIFPTESEASQPGESVTIGPQPGTVCLENVEQLQRDSQELILEACRSVVPDIRLLATTHADLEDSVWNETLIPEFYLLITTIRIELPALRNRPDDLEPLAQFFLEDGNRGNEKQISGFDPAVWPLFRDYQWPGNLRELRTVVDESRADCDGTMITADHLPFRFRTGLDAQSVGPVVQTPAAPLDDQLTAYEADLIRNALEQTRHNKTLAAKLLGIPRPKLYRRMESLGIDDREES